MKIEVKENGVRIDKYLSGVLEDVTRSKIQSLIKEKKILVNDDEAKQNYKVSEGDVISVLSLDKLYNKIVSEDIPIDIVFEDNYLMVINKTSGMVVHPAPGHYNGTLVNALMHHTQDLSTINGDVRPGIVHRIDKDTSGLLVVAKTDEVHVKLSEELKKRNIKRKYKALVWGIIPENSAEISAPIGRDKKDAKKMAITSEKSKHAKTYFRVIERFANVTYIECSLDTGRTHQIRVHLEYIGFPIVNDPIYGNRKILNDTGQMLHAYSLNFIHPITNKDMHFECDIPDKFKNVLDSFKN